MQPTSGRVIRELEVRSFEHTPGGRLRFFHGDEHEFGPISVATSTSPLGGGAPEHRHPCAELFVVVEGQGTYRIDDVEVIAEPGDVVVVPPQAWHSFRATGEVPLRHVGAFPASHVEIEQR